MPIQIEIYGSLLIFLVTFLILSVIKRFYQVNLNNSTEKLFFDDWSFFEKKHQQNPILANAYFRKKTQDVIQRFVFYRVLFFLLWLTAVILVIMPIELITDYFKVGLNISFSAVIIYIGYLLWIILQHN